MHIVGEFSLSVAAQICRSSGSLLATDQHFH